jgi:hypothetical protein
LKERSNDIVVQQFLFFASSRQRRTEDAVLPSLARACGIRFWARDCGLRQQFRGYNGRGNWL